MIPMRNRQGSEILLMEPTPLIFHRYLLLLSHTRSYSTLFCHILGSHPQICGYTEAMITYETAVDLIKLNCAAFRAGNYRWDCEYVVDKLLYDHLTVSDVVLNNPRVTPIFLVREPEAAIASLVRQRVREHEQGILDWGALVTDRASTTEMAVEYYTMRLETLRAFCGRLEALGTRGIFLPAESLLVDTSATFRFLERTLDLCAPLSEEYTVFDKTGEAGFGGTSSTIRCGRIVRDRPVSDDITIPTELLERARQAHAECLGTLRGSPALMQVGG